MLIYIKIIIFFFEHILYVYDIYLLIYLFL